MTDTRDNKTGRFGPGNPGGGRKKLEGEAREAVDLARSLTLKAIERLAELMHSKDEDVSIKACNAILDRGLGKAVQPMVGHLDINVSDARELPREKLLEIAGASVH